MKINRKNIASWPAGKETRGQNFPSTFSPCPAAPRPPCLALLTREDCRPLAASLPEALRGRAMMGVKSRQKGQHTLPRVSPNTELRRASSSSCDLYAMAVWSISLRGLLYFPQFHPSTDFFIPSQPLKALRIYLSIIFYPQSISIIKENGVIGILR